MSFRAQIGPENARFPHKISVAEGPITCVASTQAAVSETQRDRASRTAPLAGAAGAAGAARRWGRQNRPQRECQKRQGREGSAERQSGRAAERQSGRAPWAEAAEGQRAQRGQRELAMRACVCVCACTAKTSLQCARARQTGLARISPIWIRCTCSGVSVGAGAASSLEAV